MAQASPPRFATVEQTASVTSFSSRGPQTLTNPMDGAGVAELNVTNKVIETMTINRTIIVDDCKISNRIKNWWVG